MSTRNRQPGHHQCGSLQLREAQATEPLRRIDESELAPTDRALITRSVLLAYRYGTGDPYNLSVEVTRFPEERFSKQSPTAPN